jgi:hypothetical protein
VRHGHEGWSRTIPSSDENTGPAAMTPNRAGGMRAVTPHAMLYGVFTGGTPPGAAIRAASIMAFVHGGGSDALTFASASDAGGRIQKASSASSSTRASGP